METQYLGKFISQVVGQNALGYTCERNLSVSYIFYVEMIFSLLSTGNLRVYYLFRMWSGMVRQAKPYLDPPGLFSSPSVGTGR